VTPFSVNETESTLGQHQCRVKASDAGENDRAFLSFDEFVMERGGVPSWIPLINTIKPKFAFIIFIYSRENRMTADS
jgi:hypothetical protein